jgi:hypothetical protein
VRGAAALLASVPAAAAFLITPPACPSHAPAAALPLQSRAGPSRQQPHAASPLVCRFTVGGEAPVGPTLQEAFNSATGIAALVVGGLVALEIYKDLPGGWVNEQLVEAGPSTLGPQAGRGLFAAADIPKGTCIGEYPGCRVSKGGAWLARKEGEAAVVLASRYAWTLANGDLLDPTLPNGELPERLVALGGLIQKPTLLALINEPPPSIDVNLLPIVTDSSVSFVAERDIYSGEELWVDYGPLYDRRHYRRR